jgi:beta-lactamase regulating signal transducer with metallopeptidase domain
MIKISELLLNFIINATWQIAVIALLATAIARLLNNAPARYRHLLWVGVLLLSVALPVWSVFGTKTEESPRQMANRIAQEEIGRGVSEDAPVKLKTTRPGTTLGPTPRPAFAGYLFQNRIQQLSTGPTLVVVLSFVYLLFVLYRLARLWRFWRSTEALKRSIYHKQISGSMAAVAARCRSAFGIKEVPVMCTAMTSAPGVVGGRQPVIILPESFFGELPSETLYSILGHEMAHIARRDFQLNLAYEFLCLPISFHPLASFLKQQIDRTRELACDELVTEKLLEPVAHARSLLRIAGALITPADQALTHGIFDANILDERIIK